MNYKESEFYPNSKEVDQWVDSIWELADSMECKVEVLNINANTHSMGNHNNTEFTYIKFNSEGLDPFYGYWQPTHSTPAPLLVHVPGYGAEMSMHPELISQGYHVLHISPLGYATPSGPDETKKRSDNWPVLPDTVTSSAEKGYKLWLINCILAIKWAQGLQEVLNQRISFFGTSQGGGGALLLGSIYRDKGVRCVAADLPFLTNFPMSSGRGAYRHATMGLNKVKDSSIGWKHLGYIDTLSHAERLTVPVLLTAGVKDDVCPPETIESLFNVLPSTRSLTYLIEGTHRYSREFIPLASSWFRLYA